MYRITDSDRFTAQVAQRTDIPRLNQAIDAIRWALCNNPFAFPQIPGNDAIRVARTEALAKTDGTSVTLRVWIRVAGQNVELLLVETLAEI